MEAQSLIAATLEATSQYTSELEGRLDGLPVDTRISVILAVHELLVNIVQHAYAGAPGSIDIKIRQTKTGIDIMIVDMAENGFEMPETAPEPDMLDLPEHGMGLFIIQQTFDQVRYQHLSPGNVWHLSKTIGA